MEQWFQIPPQQETQSVGGYTVSLSRQGASVALNLVCCLAICPDGEAYFLRLQIPQAPVVNAPDGVRSNDALGLSRAPSVPTTSIPGACSPLPAHLLASVEMPALEFLLFLSTTLWLHLLMLEYFGF